ncbi:hypothetical protein KKY_2629 [Pelagibacterium halotolerans B2]|uniref:Uncharacterized protein n=1 Tax=Pelagibacterium halotolerans (strain DSM 22347 / JCM 15775 / CGMCC 1.7692 / B2) TaxID=1082931 RepID=G4RBG1_PELHB|nr:hypothetical protein KKY_2629 [Pelagibacterium halotolerans B2]
MRERDQYAFADALFGRKMPSRPSAKPCAPYSAKRAALERSP